VELAPEAQVVVALAGLDAGSLTITTEPSPGAAWQSVASGAELRLEAAGGRNYAWPSGSLRVLLAVAADDQAAGEADSLIPSPESDASSDYESDVAHRAHAYRRAGRLLVHIQIDGWPDRGAPESASAIAAAIIATAGDEPGD
jgi:hypothetical protein